MLQLLSEAAKPKVDPTRSYGGIRLNGTLSLTEALKATGLDWSVELDEVTLATYGTVIPGIYGTYRSDNRYPLGTVRSRYSPIQNYEAYAWAEPLIESGDLMVVAGGIINVPNRYMVWLAFDAGYMEIVPGDTLRKHIVAVNTHDGSSDFLTKVVPLREYDATQLDFPVNWEMPSVRHTKSASNKLSELDDTLRLAHINFNEVESMFSRMADTRIPWEVADRLVYKSLGASDKEVEAWKSGKIERLPQWVNQRLTIERLLTRGAVNVLPSIENTIWNVYTSICSFADHYRVVRGSDKDIDVRLESRLFGVSSSLKLNAYNICSQFVENTTL